MESDGGCEGRVSMRRSCIRASLLAFPLPFLGGEIDPELLCR